MFQPLFFSFLFDEFSLPPCFHFAFQERVEGFMAVANHRKRRSSAKYVSVGAFESHVFNLVKESLDVVFTAWIIAYNIFTLCNVIFKYYI